LRPYPPQSNSEYPDVLDRSQTVGAKLHWSKGEKPRSQSKVPKFMLSVKGSVITYTTRRLA
jgi:hypothetical protein